MNEKQIEMFFMKLASHFGVTRERVARWEEIEARGGRQIEFEKIALWMIVHPKKARRK